MAARWTEEEKALAANAAGILKPETIAKAVHKSTSAVQNYARKNGISLGIQRKPFSPDEDETLSHHVALGVPAPSIAQKMGRSVKSVRGRIDYLRKRQADEEGA